MGDVLRASADHRLREARQAETNAREAYERLRDKRTIYAQDLAALVVAWGTVAKLWEEVIVRSSIAEEVNDGR